jgi:hypothetical protein
MAFGVGVSICQSNSCIFLFSLHTIQPPTNKSQTVFQLSPCIFVLADKPNGVSVAPIYFCSCSQPKQSVSWVCKLCPYIFVLAHNPNSLSVGSVSCARVFLFSLTTHTVCQLRPYILFLLTTQTVCQLGLYVAPMYFCSCSQPKWSVSCACKFLFLLTTQTVCQLRPHIFVLLTHCQCIHISANIVIK